jgi:hypothetical protein
VKVPPRRPEADQHTPSNRSPGTAATRSACFRWCSDSPASVAASVRVTDGRAPSCRFCLRLFSEAGGISLSGSPQRRIAAPISGRSANN